MNWANLFVWDGEGGNSPAVVEGVYERTIQLLRAFRMRQATLAVRAEVLDRINEREKAHLLRDLRDLGVLHQVEFAAVQSEDLSPASLREGLREELGLLRAQLGPDVILRGVYAPLESDPFDLVDTYRQLGIRWVVLDPDKVLGPYVDLLDDTIYELSVPGTVYAYFPDADASGLLREAQGPTSRQFKEHFPTKLDRKCYLVTVLRESDLLSAPKEAWDLLEDLYADPS
ncbi:MAG: hypothetical protein ONB23_06485, partial [candidate division KSB1 bacterium]|nr:hypothetical protein [candidate division KSB1 bacterium]